MEDEQDAASRSASSVSLVRTPTSCLTIAGVATYIIRAQPMAAPASGQARPVDAVRMGVAS
jgi:hypothetical protein